MISFTNKNDRFHRDSAIIFETLSESGICASKQTVHVNFFMPWIETGASNFL